MLRSSGIWTIPGQSVNPKIVTIEPTQPAGWRVANGLNLFDTSGLAAALMRVPQRQAQA